MKNNTNRSFFTEGNGIVILQFTVSDFLTVNIRPIGRVVILYKDKAVDNMKGTVKFRDDEFGDGNIGLRGIMVIDPSRSGPTQDRRRLSQPVPRGALFIGLPVGHRAGRSRA